MVDDHELFRDGVSLYLNMQADIHLQHAVGSPAELHALFENGKPDVLLMDISMPQQSGIDLTRQILKTHPHQKVVYLTGNEHTAYLELALRSGARGFVPKSASRSELAEAVRRVHHGDFFFPTDVSQEVYRKFVQRLKSQDTPELTDRELEVLRCFANGLSFKEIEDQLNISKKTIENHKKAIFDKLGFQSNADLVKYAVKYHIIELD